MCSFGRSGVWQSLTIDHSPTGESMSRNEYRNLIGGQWLPARSGKTFSNVNPADHTDLVGEFPASGPEDVDDAVGAAKKAFATWRLTPAPKRAEILYRAGRLLQERKEK